MTPIQGHQDLADTRRVSNMTQLPCREIKCARQSCENKHIGRDFHNRDYSGNC